MKIFLALIGWASAILCLIIILLMMVGGWFELRPILVLSVISVASFYFSSKKESKTVMAKQPEKVDASDKFHWDMMAKNIASRLGYLNMLSEGKINKEVYAEIEKDLAKRCKTIAQRLAEEQMANKGSVTWSQVERDITIELTTK